MPIPGVDQPEVLQIDETLRLRRFDDDVSLALDWYQDPETVFLVDGVRKAYTPEKLGRMYRYLNSKGELYWIELLRDGSFVPVGDVTFWHEDMPIVVGEKGLRGQGIGRRVIAALAGRAKTLGYPEIFVREIYEWNTVSQKCFESVGFVPHCKTGQGYGYRLAL